MKNKLLTLTAVTLLSLPQFSIKAEDQNIVKPTEEVAKTLIEKSGQVIKEFSEKARPVVKDFSAKAQEIGKEVIEKSKEIAKEFAPKGKEFGNKIAKTLSNAGKEIKNFFVDNKPEIEKIIEEVTAQPTIINPTMPASYDFPVASDALSLNIASEPLIAQIPVQMPAEVATQVTAQILAPIQEPVICEPKTLTTSTPDFKKYYEYASTKAAGIWAVTKDKGLAILAFTKDKGSNAWNFTKNNFKSGANYCYSKVKSIDKKTLIISGAVIVAAIALIANYKKIFKIAKKMGSKKPGTESATSNNATSKYVIRKNVKEKEKKEKLYPSTEMNTGKL